MMRRGPRISVLAAVVLINSTAMGNRGRLIAPGGLRDELAAVAEDAPAAGESLAEMAAQYGLRPSSARPRLVSYLVKVWQRRHFILAYATARNVSMYTEARLGQLWQVRTPLLNSAVYYLIFGILFKANRGIGNYTAFLGANSLIITVFGEEEQSGDGCEHALELADRAAVAAAFPAEHPPCLHFCHGVLDGGADLAEDRVEFTLPVQEFRSAEALEWHDPDAVDSDVAEVGASIAGGHGFRVHISERC